MKKIDLRVPMLRKDYLYASIGYCLKMLLKNQNNRAAFTAIASEVMAQIEPEFVSVTEPKYLTQDGWQVEISKRLLVVLVKYYPEIC